MKLGVVACFVYVSEVLAGKFNGNYPWMLDEGRNKRPPLFFSIYDRAQYIKDADVLLVFARRLNLRDEQMAPIRARWEAGKGIVGIRTSSHAFGDADNEMFDRKVMGGNYQGHFGDEKVVVSVTEEGAKHPVMTRVGKMESAKLYKAGELGDGAVVLQKGTVGEGKEGAIFSGGFHAAIFCQRFSQ